MAVFAVSGAWICSPLLEGGSYSGSVASAGGGLSSASSSLDSAFNPNGAPGGVLDLSMEKPVTSGLSAGAAASSLYQAPEGGAPGAPIVEGSPTAGAEASATLAAALKQVSEKKADPGGWGGQKPLKGFTPPKANFAPLSGLGAAGSGGGGSGARIGAFGAVLPNTGVATARGLSGSVSEAPMADARGRALGGLRNAAAAGRKIALLGEGDAAVADSRRFFDGSHQAGGAITGGGAGDGGLGGAFGSLSAAPANLKANRTDLDHFEITPPPGKPAAPPDNTEEMKKQLMMVAVSMVVMGVAGPMAGMIVMQAIPMVTAAAQQKALQEKAAAELSAGRRI